jgi:hypothetical protein
MSDLYKLMLNIFSVDLVLNLLGMVIFRIINATVDIILLRWPTNKS